VQTAQSKVFLGKKKEGQLGDQEKKAQKSVNERDRNMGTAGLQ